MTILAGFLSAAERQHLLAMARDPARIWSAGRQETGYARSPVADPALAPLVTRSLAAIHGGPLHGHDVWLLHYGDGAFIPPHVDPPLTDGAHHGRLNAIIAAAGGGVLILDGAEVPLAPGDAIVFRPDVQRHAVTPVVGERFVWSVGCNY
jgi:hypothetical protein